MNFFFNSRYFRYFDFTLTILTFSLLFIGLFFVFSSTYEEIRPFSIFFKKQLFGSILGIFIYFIASIIKDFKNITRLGFYLYFVVLSLLIYTSISGFLGMGARRWISLHYFRVQPSELVKLLLPLLISFYFFENHQFEDRRHKNKKYLVTLVLIFLSFIFIRNQPDLGTALIILFSNLILLWVIGLNKKFFIISSILILLGAPILWKTLKPYQQNRILVLLGYGNSKKEGYQIEQSKIAIGSGGIFGKGILAGTQNKLGFLPEDHTDFIFSVVCEEIGFIGAFLIIFLFCILFLKILIIILSTKNKMYAAAALGLALHIILSVLINIGMVLGLLPAVGIPLPLFTYGIANLWVTLASLGLINNLSIRSKVN